MPEISNSKAMKYLAAFAMLGKSGQIQYLYQKRVKSARKEVSRIIMIVFKTKLLS